MKPDYIIKLQSGGEIPLLFNNWTFTQFSAKKGMDFDELEALIFQDDPRPFKMTEVPMVLLLAHETWCFFNDQEFKAKEKDAFLWIEETGGMRSTLYAETYKRFLMRYLNLTDAQLEVQQKAIQKQDAPKSKGSKKKETAA